MNCKIEATTNERLQNYVDKFGQAEGLKRFLKESTGSNPLTFDTITADKEVFGVKFMYEYSLDSATSRASAIKDALGDRFVNIIKTKDSRNRDMWKIIITNPNRIEVSDELVGVTSDDPFSILTAYLSGQRRFKYNRKSRLDARIAEYKRDGNIKDLKAAEALRTRTVNEIAELETEIENFEHSKDAENLKTIASTQLSWVASVLGKENITPSEMREANYIIDLWSNARRILYDDIEEVPDDINTALNDIRSRVDSNDLTGNWWRVASAYLANGAKYESASALIQEMNNIKDLDFVGAYGLDLSRTASKLLSSTDELVRNATSRAEMEYKQRIAEIQDVFKNLKDKGKNIDLLWQLDEQGEKNGNLVNRYAQAWWTKSKANRNKLKYELKAIAAAKLTDKAERTAKRKAYREYFNWVKNNSEAIDIRFFINSDFTNETHNKKSYIEYLESLFGTERTKDIIRQANEQYNKYLEAEKATEEDLLSRVASGELKQEEYKAKYDEWVLNNSPEVWFSQNEPGATEFFQGHNDYIISKPKKFINGNRTEWYDTKYEQIENDAEMLEAYNFIRDFMQEMMSYLPKYLTKDQDVHAGFLPRIKKELMMALTGKDLVGSIAAMKEDWISSITSPDGLDHRHLEIDPSTGLPYKNIPTAFITNMPIDDRSTELDKILGAFARMAIEYKWKSRVEDSALLTSRFLAEVSTSENRKQNMGSDDLKGMKELLTYFQDVLLYNQAKLNEGVSNLKIFQGNSYIADDDILENVRARYKVLASEDVAHETILTMLKDEYKDKIQIVSAKKKFKHLEELRDIIEEKLYNKDITEEDYNNLIAPLEEDAKGLGRNLVWSKIGDKLLRYNQAMALGFNPFSAINNYFFGVNSNIMWAAGNTDFTPRQMWQAFGIMWKSVLSINNKTMDKAANLIALFDILAESIEYKSDGQNKTLERIKNAPFAMLKGGDYMIKGQTFIAMMLHEKITDLAGNERTLYDAYDDNGKWKTDEFGENKGWEGNVTNETELVDFYKFKNKTNQIIKKLHGNFDPKSPPRYKKYILGRMLGQFRFTWMIEGYAQRFETKKYDNYLERDIEGRFRTMGRLGFSKSLKVLARLALFQSNAMQGIKAQDRALVEENMRRNLMELYLYAIMTAVFLMLKAGLDDEDDEAELIAMNLLTRLMADTTFYLSPNTFTSIIQDPIPIIKIYTRGKRAFDSAGELLFNGDLTEHETEQKWANVTNAFPYINQYNRFKYLATKVRQY